MNLTKIDYRKWGSKKAVYDFLMNQQKKINKVCFNNALTEIDVQVHPMTGRVDLFNNLFCGGKYLPAGKGLKPQIILFPCALLNKDVAKRGLAHGMIHHWEHSFNDNPNGWNYPEELNEIVYQRFKGKRTSREALWRERHSSRFLAKAYQVARKLNISLENFLFG